MKLTFNENMSIYERHSWLYVEATPETRTASKEYWIREHQKNIKAKRDDLIMFSGQMLGAILLAEEYLQNPEGVI